MERKTSELGLNRTGIKTSPVRGKEIVEASEQSIPSSPGDASALGQVRAEFAAEMPGLGSVPPPVGLKGMAKTAVDLLKGGRASVFIDKLAERAGFERTGVRIYEAVLSKLDVFGTWEGGPTREELEDIRRDELAHFALLVRTIEQLGGDSTALTPSAELASNLSIGVPRTLTDPHVNLLQCVQGLLMIELTDNASWDLLISLARELGHASLAEEFHAALVAEADHLVTVRGWFETGTLLEARVGEEAAGAPA